MPPWQSCTCVQTRASTPQDKGFDIDNVSGSDNDNELPHGNHSPHVESPSQETCIPNNVNNPDTIHVSKNTSHDIYYFFRMIGDNNVCIVCRQVFLRSWLLSFLICHHNPQDS